MQSISIKAMLETGVHFGHQTRRWNPKMQRYIYGSRNNIHIIDLQKSAKELRKALKFVTDMTLKGEAFLFVGTKRQAQEAVKAEAQRCGAFYVCNRWVGGTLTNFPTVRKSIERLLQMEKMETQGIKEVLNKKEVRKFMREYAALLNKYEGLKEMKRPPAALFVVDPTEEETATLEANRMDVPIVAICDTNADPDLIDYPIPGNDDALRSIRFFTTAIADAILEAKSKLAAADNKVAAQNDAAKSVSENAGGPAKAQQSENLEQLLTAQPAAAPGERGDLGAGPRPETSAPGAPEAAVGDSGTLGPGGADPALSRGADPAVPMAEPMPTQEKV